ncbi:MAG: hypothetical protein IKH26_07025 [Bacteroidaceae bacterium]|nr:hypothetical protein [Bacteroidaceae bacterium]
MDTRKMIMMAGLMGLLCCSCGQRDTANMDLTELQMECDRLRQERSKALENNVEAQKLIDNIFASINSISGRTANLERSLEDNSGSSNRIKAEEIAKDIASIKQKLERAEEMESIDQSTKLFLEKLKTTLRQKEQEIDELKTIIRQKDEQITMMDQQISSLDDELGQTNRQLKESNEELANTREELRESEINSWLNMGDELIRAAETLPKVKGHGNMKPVKVAKLTFILKAKGCYLKAQQLGSSTASSKISNAERIYRLNN